jgi:PTS system glucitol/sorbitol-specific IIA component
MTMLFSAEVTSVGPDATEMFEGGVAVFFGEPCPDALAEVSVVHRVTVPPQRDPRPGDVLRVGGSSVEITAVGELAAQNLRELGHVVVYGDPEPSQQLLPGAMFARGAIAEPVAGDLIVLEGGE